MSGWASPERAHADTERRTLCVPCPGGGMENAADSKSIVRKDVRVQVPPRAPEPVDGRRPTHRRPAVSVARHYPPVTGRRHGQGLPFDSRCSPSRSPARARSDRVWAGRGSNTRAGSSSTRREIADRDVARLLLDADADELKDTRNAQLTTFVSSLMVLDAAERLGLEPELLRRHSLGEYTASPPPAALAFDEGVRLVTERADVDARRRRREPGHHGRRPRARRRRGRGRLPSRRATSGWPTSTRPVRW